MSSNYQRLSLKKHFLPQQNSYKSYKQGRQASKNPIQDKRKEIQFTCGNKLSTYSDDQLTFQGEKSEPLTFSLDNFDEEMGKSQSIAQTVINENIKLKQELQSMRKQNSKIKLELQSMNNKYQQAKNNIDVSLYQQKIKQLREEMILTLTQNREITEEILMLKKSVSHQKENVTNWRYNSRLSFKSITNGLKGRSSSMQVNQRKFHKINEETEQDQHHKEKELLESIKLMYTKITGYKNQSLKQLWRWLKDIGHFYSRFRKWKSKALDCLQDLYNQPLSYQELLALINQSVGLIQ